MPSLTTANDLRRYFLPYQIRWICDEHSIAIAEKSRRIGWTYASAFRAVDRRLRLGTNLFYTSADLTAAREFIEDCCRWARVFQAVAEDVGERIIDEAEGMTALVLRFSNGARIVAGSSNPKFFRSKGGDADADELAFHEQPRELYKAMQPAALIWGHQLRMWSTHNGEGSFFHRLLQNNRKPVAVEGDDGAMTGQPITTHRVTLLDAVNQGLVERIRNLPEANLSARKAFIEEIRASCPDESAWREEYLCEPAAEGAALLSYALITGCEAANLQLASIESLAENSGSFGQSLFAGFDVGRKQDRSVLWVVERVGDVLWTRAVHVLGETPFSAQEQLLDRLLVGRRVRRLCVDSTGIGAMLAERLAQRHGHRVEAMHFTVGVKSSLAMPLHRLFQEKLVRIPADPAVREDLHKVRRTITAAHHIRLDAPRDADGHADRFWALAMACHAAELSPATVTPSLPRKPVGW